MTMLPLRLSPGDDLRDALTTVLARENAAAGYVLQAIGSLSVAQLRFAGRSTLTDLRGDLEILTLAGSLSPDGAHLHMSVSDTDGKVMGGHVGAGCLVRTTVEVLVALLADYRFSREHDPASGFDELAVRRLPDPV